MSKSISNRKLAAALGISPARVTALAKRGMPTDSVAAAEAWRDANLDPSWARKRPPAELELTDAWPEVSAPPDPVEIALSQLVPELLWRPELLAIAAREAGVRVTGEQVLKMSGFYVLLGMCSVNDALGTDLRFRVSHFPARDSPEEAALIRNLEAIFQPKNRS